MIPKAPKPQTFNKGSIGILVGLLVLLFILVAVFVILYRRKVVKKSRKGNKPTEIHLPDVELFQPSSTLISEPNTPTHLELSARTFQYPNSRSRFNSSSSANSSTPLIRRNGSYRSRFSSGVSSRLDSNITEGENGQD